MYEIKVPELAESISEGTISQWMVKEGDEVKEGDVLFELETDKVNIEISAENSGVLSEILSREGETVQEGDVVARLSEGANIAATDRDDPGPSPNHTELSSEHKDKTEARMEESEQRTVNAVKRADKVFEDEHTKQMLNDLRTAPPSARKRARERGLDVPTVEQLDHDRQDNRNTKPEEKNRKQNNLEQNDQHPEKPVERIRMSRRRQTIAARLVQAQQTAAMLTTFNEVDMSAIMDLRKRKKEAFEHKHGVKLGFMSFFTSAVIGALKAFPKLNAEIDGDEIVLKKYYDIGIAVSTDEGLVVPVLRQADKLNFAEMEREIAWLAEKARHKDLRLSDLQGGTFTITNGGVFGSLLSTPILNIPQVGILGMHKIQQRPVTLKDGSMDNRPMMYIALSYDHRIVDGSEAVSFLVRVKELLEDPEDLLLEG